MKSSATNQTSTIRSTLSRSIRDLAIVSALLGAALLAQGAFATDQFDNCPPPNHMKGPVCVPGPAQPQSHYVKSVVPNQGEIVPIGTKHKTPVVERRIADPYKVAPQIDPGPRHDAGGTHSIIFVGGHSQASNDKAALNPQPIPPGRVRTSAHTLQNTNQPHWDLSKNHRS